MYNLFFLVVFFITTQIFATVYLRDDRGFMDYQDFLAIQKNCNVFEHKNNFYQIKISDSNLQILNQKRMVLTAQNGQ